MDLVDKPAYIVGTEIRSQVACYVQSAEVTHGQSSYGVNERVDASFVRIAFASQELNAWELGWLSRTVSRSKKSFRRRKERALAKVKRTKNSRKCIRALSKRMGKPGIGPK